MISVTQKKGTRCTRTPKVATLGETLILSLLAGLGGFWIGQATKILFGG